jgi:outer membrane protein TolC
MSHRSRSIRGLDAEAKLLAGTTAAYAIALRLTQTLHSGGAVAGLDVARAQTQLQTSISLDGTGGFENTGSGNVLTAANSWRTLGPMLATTLFDGGRRRAALRAARDQFDEAGSVVMETLL